MEATSVMARMRSCTSPESSIATVIPGAYSMVSTFKYNGYCPSAEYSV